MKIRKKILSCTTSLATLQSFIIPTIICSCSKANDSNELIVSGPKKIFIDHSSGERVVGRCAEKFVVQHNGQIIDNHDLFWEIVDCDDANIFINNGYIEWNNPKLVNHSFFVKVSKLDDTGTKYIYGLSEQITLMADPESSKIEFAYEGSSLPYLIRAKSGESGKQDGKWTFEFNGEPYKGTASSLKLVQKNGISVNGVSIDNNGQIQWSDNLSPGTYELYLSIKIVDSLGVSHTIAGSNNYIALSVSKPDLFFEIDDAINFSANFKTQGDIVSYKLYNIKAEDITSKDTTTWRINVIEGTQELKEYVKVVNGVVSYIETLPIGNYKFNVIASDNARGKTLASKTISLECLSPCELCGGNTSIDANANVAGKDILNPWYLKIDNEIVNDANYEIVPSVDSQKEKIEKLKQFVSCEKITTALGQCMCISWQPGFDNDIYFFKIKATSGARSTLSDSIKFKAYSDTEPFIKIKSDFTKGSFVKGASSDKENEDYILESPISTYFCRYESGKAEPTEVKLPRSEVKYTFSGLSGAQVDIDNNNEYLHIKQTHNLQSTEPWQIMNLTINAEWTYSSKVLSDSFTIEFNVGNTSNQIDIIKTYGDSYNYWKNEPHSELDQDDMNRQVIPGDSIQLNPAAATKYPSSMTRGHNSSFIWAAPTIDRYQDDLDVLTMLDVDQKRSDNGDYYDRFAQYQPVEITVKVAPHAKKKIAIYLTTQARFQLHRTSGLIQDERLDKRKEWVYRYDIYDLGSSPVLPNYIHGVQEPASTIEQEKGLELSKPYRKENNAILVDRELFNEWDDNPIPFLQRKDPRNTMSYDGSGKRYSQTTSPFEKNMAIALEFTNNSDNVKLIKRYIGVSVVTCQGSWANGPGIVNFSLKTFFNFKKQVDSSI